jgi:D-alanyl-D-alanine carboxypeptidase/D-alanyl-D-alanine-endopeptidase (penicillin-binding protein 4)
VLHGNLWIIGHGDPEVGRADLVALADAIERAGVKAIGGRVIGDEGPFRRDWFAPGWKRYFPRYYVAMPTALTFEQNTSPKGVHITDPELLAARFLTTKLEARGIHVRRKAAARVLHARVREVASIRSAPLATVIRHMDMRSRNFYAEVLGKKLGSVAYGTGSIAAAARAIDTFVDRAGEHFTLHDASGLSYANRATAAGILRLLWRADAAPWGETLRDALPHGNQGTLEGRLPKILLRAKTGTLDHASALSGWVWLQRSKQWAEFSILSSGFSEWTAKGIEDQIVRVISQKAVDPSAPI